MPRVSREQADKNREAIEEASSRLFRERGLSGVSVADLMAGAGLTHGGFYGHFESKDALAALACRRAFEEAAGRWTRRVGRAGEDKAAQLASLVKPYLAAAHRNHPGQGCAAASLAGDVAREPAGKPVREAYTEGLKDLVATLADTAPQDDPVARRQTALVQMSTLVGAMMLARATAGDPLSDEILAAVRRELLGDDA